MPFPLTASRIAVPNQMLPRSYCRRLQSSWPTYIFSCSPSRPDFLASDCFRKSAAVAFCKFSLSSRCLATLHHHSLWILHPHHHDGHHHHHYPGSSFPFTHRLHCCCRCSICTCSSTLVPIGTSCVPVYCQPSSTDGRQKGGPCRQSGQAG